jgi:hypothetical protein
MPLQISRPTVQDDWEAGYIELSIASSAAPLGVNSSIADLRPQLAVNRSVIPDQRKTMTVTIVSDVASVSSAGMFMCRSLRLGAAWLDSCTSVRTNLHITLVGAGPKGATSCRAPLRCVCGACAEATPYQAADKARWQCPSC